MNIDRIVIENISQVIVGDIVVVVDKRTMSTQYARVSRVLKTKFELEYDSGEKVEYSTDISHGHIYRKGETKDERHQRIAYLEVSGLRSLLHVA